MTCRNITGHNTARSDNTSYTNRYTCTDRDIAGYPAIVLNRYGFAALGVCPYAIRIAFLPSHRMIRCQY